MCENIAPEKAVPKRGTAYEAKEGARGGKAVREVNCQVLRSIGGPKSSTLRTVSLGSASAANTSEISTPMKSGAAMWRRE